MTELTAGQRALTLLEKLLRVGDWYSSAIELDQHFGEPVDGEELEKEAREIMSQAINEAKANARTS